MGRIREFGAPISTWLGKVSKVARQLKINTDRARVAGAIRRAALDLDRRE